MQVGKSFFVFVHVLNSQQSFSFSVAIAIVVSSDLVDPFLQFAFIAHMTGFTTMIADDSIIITAGISCTFAWLRLLLLVLILLTLPAVFGGMVVLAAVCTAAILCPFSTVSASTSTTSTTSMVSTAFTTTSVKACSRFGVDNCGFHLILFLGLLKYRNEIWNSNSSGPFEIANSGLEFGWCSSVDVGP